MNKLPTLIVVLLAALGLAWWQRDTVVPFITGHVPGSAPILARIPGLMPAVVAKDEDAASQGGRRRGAGGAVPVSLAKAESKVLPVEIDAIGTVQASASIPIHPRVDSQIVAVEVQEGAKVTKGDPLFRLDDRAVRAQLAQIDAQIIRDQVQIDQANVDLKRAEDLLTRSAGSQVTRDTSQTAVAVAKAQLAADQAQRVGIQTTLSYTVIGAPVSGRIGSVPVQAGSIVRAADATALATVNQLDPANVSFSIPQARLPELRQAMGRGPVRVEVTEGKATVPGEVGFIENAVDQTTGTIAVTARVPNPDEVLWPGSFVKVSVVLENDAPAIAVPTAALQLGQDGPYLFVVDHADKSAKAQLRQVTVARTAGPDSVVTAGVKAGESVVVDGQLRLVDGAAVAVKTPPTAGAPSGGPVEASIGGNG